MDGPDARRELGLGAGKVYPASRAALLLNPLRRVLQPPRRIVEALDLDPDDRVLELGCGPGWFSPALVASVPRGRLVMVDLQPEMLRRARRRVAPASRAALTAGDATALPARDESFDMVFVSAVLGEVPDRNAALAEVARVLRPGGQAAVVETRTDPDFIALPDLRDAMGAQGLELVHHRRARTQYIARFRRNGAAAATTTDGTNA